MIFLRVLGFIVAIALFTSVVRRRRRGVLALTDTLIYATLSLGLAVLAIVPAAAAPVLNAMGFRAGDQRRVVGVLFISNIIAYVLILRSFAKTDRVEVLLGDYADRLAARHFAWEFGMDSEAPPSPDHLSVVIPALNEEQALPDVLKAVPRQVEGLDVEIIVVSDGSTDSTEEVARRYGALVVGSDLRRGQGAAVALGYRMAIARGAAVVATIDADGQYDPSELPSLVRPILEGDADVVHGSRVLGAYERPMFGRAQGVKVFARLMSIMAKHPITDPASGFRAFRADALGRLRFREHQFHASEVTVAAAKEGLRVKEIPCTFRERFHGTTKKPPLLQYGWGYARSLLRTWLG